MVSSIRLTDSWDKLQSPRLRLSGTGTSVRPVCCRRVSAAQGSATLLSWAWARTLKNGLQSMQRLERLICNDNQDPMFGCTFPASDLSDKH
jgi:hypothetical protein